MVLLLSQASHCQFASNHDEKHLEHERINTLSFLDVLWHMVHEAMVCGSSLHDGHTTVRSNVFGLGMNGYGKGFLD